MYPLAYQKLAMYVLLIFLLFIIQQFMVNLPLKGRVDLENPDDLFYICEDYGPNPNSAPEEPFYVYVGRKVGAIFFNRGFQFSFIIKNTYIVP